LVSTAGGVVTQQLIAAIRAGHRCWRKRQAVQLHACFGKGCDFSLAIFSKVLGNAAQTYLWKISAMLIWSVTGVHMLWSLS